MSVSFVLNTFSLFFYGFGNLGIALDERLQAMDWIRSFLLVNRTFRLSSEYIIFFCIALSTCFYFRPHTENPTIPFLLLQLFQQMNLRNTKISRSSRIGVIELRNTFNKVQSDAKSTMTLISEQIRPVRNLMRNLMRGISRSCAYASPQPHCGSKT
jgi:hypothetical protein